MMSIVTAAASRTLIPEIRSNATTSNIQLGVAKLPKALKNAPISKGSANYRRISNPRLSQFV
jgi:hypothetical protein